MSREMLFGDAMMQMCDGIHRPHSFMHIVDDKVTYRNVRAAKELMQVEIKKMTRDEFLEHLEEIGASFGDMEKVYGEYDSFAKASDGTAYFAWYNNDR